MKVRQEESTPIGNYYHDMGTEKIFSRITETVDEFEVDTDELNDCIEDLISVLKGLKAQVKKYETEYAKKVRQRELRDSLKQGYDYD